MKKENMIHGNSLPIGKCLTGSQESGVRMKREKAKQFQDLIVWQQTHRFVLGVYKHSKNFPKEERYGLTS